MYAFAWCLLNRSKHICFSDGTLKSEKTLSVLHRIVRLVFFAGSKAFVAASEGGQDLFKSYKISKNRIFRSYLSIENELYHQLDYEEKEFDLMFSGQFIERKMPFFFVEVAKEVKRRRGKCKVLLLGDGELRVQVLRELEASGIDYFYPGFIDQKSLPSWYSKAKIFLFPTQNDPWGVVANEAMAAGLPVITCPAAGAAYDLVEHEVNGYVLPLSAQRWADHCQLLLEDKERYTHFSNNALRLVQLYNSYHSAQGVIESVSFAMGKPKCVEQLNQRQSSLEAVTD
nr:glycosyltransferase family 4 protein [Pedobacter sp. SYSU D00535]